MKKLILIAGPSGAGKTTISDYLWQQYQIPRVITHTTRPKRQGEASNSYYFESDESFAQLHLFEHVHYGAYQYGSSREALAKAWEKSDLASLIVDIQGAESYVEQLKEQVYFLYVTASSLEKLRERLLNRGDSVASINKRLQGKELNELSTKLKPFAHVLVNDDWQETVAKLQEIIAGLD